jgi:hypothetical protein
MIYEEKKGELVGYICGGERVWYAGQSLGNMSG